MKKDFLNKKWKIYNTSTRLDTVSRNNYAFISTSYSHITLNQVETLRRFLVRFLNKKLKKRMIRKYSITCALFKKSKNSRMGKGIGKFDKWYGQLKPGTILFEFTLYAILNKKLLTSFYSISKRMPFKFKIFTRELKFKINIFENKKNI